MLCSHCQQREAAFEHFHVGAHFGPVCQQCAVELGAQFLQRYKNDLGGHSPTEVAQGVEKLVERFMAVMQQDPPTKDPEEILRRLRRLDSDPDSPAA